MSNVEETELPRIIGQVKWFNNKAGYGFITVSSGEQKGKDIFIHYSAIRVINSQYKYLVQGEYVEFSLVRSTSADHEYQAIEVSGISGGSLMCESRNNNVGQFNGGIGGGNGGVDRKQGGGNYPTRRYRVIERGDNIRDHRDDRNQNPPSSRNTESVDFTTVQRRRPVIRKRSVVGTIDVAVATA